jgi:thymidylate synthase
MFISAPSIDDLLSDVTEALLRPSVRVRATRGKNAELFGVMLELQDPRSRLSRTEGRGKLLSGLGELMWYLSGSNRLAFITHYLPRYERDSDDGVTVYGAYGPRLFNMRRRYNQIRDVIFLLSERPTTRRAVVQLYDAADIVSKHKEVPCTCTLQFVIRDRALHMMTHMRSNDAYLGLPHDIFSFTMLQEIIATTLDVKLGKYMHSVGSLHLYDKNRDDAKRYLKEGVQSHVSMPRMPSGDPWVAIQRVLRAEAILRTGREVRVDSLSLAPYWADIVRLLQIYQKFRNRKIGEIADIKQRLSTRIYDPYISDRLQRESTGAK